MLGPTATVTQRAIEADFRGFYESILNGESGETALGILNGPPSSDATKYYFTTAERFYDKVWQNYINNQCSGEALNSRTKRIIRNLRHASNFPRSELPSRKQLKRKLLDEFNPKHKRESLQKFFMADLFEENWQRFNLEDRIA